MLRRRLFPFIILLTSFLEGNAQSSGIPFIQNYKPRIYKASSTNYDIVQDARGLMYFANFRGVLEYDGVNWRLFPLANGAAVRSLASDSVGTVYIGGIGEMGYLTPDSLGRLAYESLLPKIDTTYHQLPEAIQVMGTQTGAWFRGYSPGQLYRWHNDSLVHYPVTQTSQENHMFLHQETLWVHSPGTGMYRWENDHFGLIPGSESLSGYRFQQIIPLPDGSLIGYDRLKGFVKLMMENEQLSITPWSSELDRDLGFYVFSMIHPLKDGKIVVGTVKGGIFILSEEGEILQNLTSEVGLQDNFILSAHQDRQGILWLALSKGISRIDVTAPLSQWNESSGLTGVVFSAIHHKNRLYASTTLGVFGFKKDQFVPVAGLGMESWKLSTVQTGGKERLIASTARGLYEIEGWDSEPIPGGTGFYKALPSDSYPGYIFSLSAIDGVEMLTHTGEAWQFMDQGIRISGRFSSMVETDHRELWLQELLNPLSLHKYDMQEGSPGLSNSTIIRLPDTFPIPQGIYSLNGELALATEKGIWMYDREAEEFVPETAIGISGYQHTTGVLRLSEDLEGRLWIERYQDNKRWLELATPQQNGRYKRDSVALRELADIEVWGEVYYGPNGHGWIGTPEGLFAYNTQSQQRRDPVFRPLIRQVIFAEDSILYHGFPASKDETPVLPYKNNSITFHYAAPYFKSESVVQYSYYLEGKDQYWSPWKSEFKKDYTLLPPGTYLFRVKARNMYAQESAESVYKFTIEAPWYRTSWAFMIYAFLLGFLVYGTVKLNTRRLHAANEHLEKIVYERTSEIWAQHKEIIKKSATLKRQKEAIAEQHELLGDKNSELEKTLAKLKSAQSKLVESEKMASLGQLTAGIAHEINNPINFVKGNVGPLKRDFEEIRELFSRLQLVKPGDQVEERLKELKQYCQEIDAPFLFEEMAQLLAGIEEGAQRTKQIVDGLKVFSRSDTDSFKMADVHQGIEATLTLLSNNLKKRVQVHTTFAKLPQIECMPGKLNQVFMNIMSNALQAMEKQHSSQDQEIIGDLYISTAESNLRNEPAIQIDIRDTGPGIPDHIQNKIFDPFFTTKDVGQGTGLGLSISFGIIEKHRGTIEIISAKEGGAMFRIILPQSQTV